MFRNRLLSNPQLALNCFIAIALLVYFGDFALLQITSAHHQSSLISFGVLLDVVLVLPAFYGLILIRRHGFPRIWLSLLLYTGVAYFYFLIPEGKNWLRMALPLWRDVVTIAISVLALSISFRIGHALRMTARANLRGETRIQALARAAAFNNAILAKALANEMLVFYYAIWGGFRAPEERPGQQRFSYHIKTGAIGMLVGLSAFQLMEIPFFHLLLSHWYPTAAWIITALSIYGLILGPAIGFAMKHRAIVLDEQGLHLQMSLLLSADIPLTSIAQVRALSWRDEVDELPSHCLRAHMMTSPNIEIQLQHELLATRMYGRQQRFNSVRLYVDEPARFIAALRQQTTPPESQ